MKELKNRLRCEFKDFITNPKKVISFLMPIIIILLLLIPMPYYVTVGGGLINLDKKIIVEKEHKQEGKFFSAYVKELKGNVLTYVLGRIIPSFELEKIKEVTLDNEDVEDYNFRERLSFESSIDNASILAYKMANKKIDIKEERLYITYIDSLSDTNLKVKDELLEINNKPITSLNSLNELIKEYNYEDKITFKVLRDGKEEKVFAKIINYNNEKKIGIAITTKYEYDLDPELTLKFGKSEQGPSGGLMMALTIYNKLVDYDITKGLKIAGTGTIDIYGNVGEIGGIKYKIAGAVKKGADVFILPEANYEEAVAICSKEGYNIKLISVDTFSKALEELSKLR